MQYGRYEIVREVGRGSMGVVYEAHDPNIGRRIALKVLRQDRMTDQGFVKRFLREARAIGRLSHPSIVAVYDVGEDQGVVYIAMEFLEGTPLNEVIRERTLTTEQIVDVGIQVAETLDYAHQKGVVHRDIKPSNMILQSDGKIKITDFGIAHIEDASGTVATQVGEIMGTPAYMAPEQVLGNPVDGRTDIFSLGALLYEWNAGRRPFGGEGKGLPTIFNEIVNVAPPEPLVSVPGIPAWLSQCIMKCLAKAPEERFQTGKELADALRTEGQTSLKEQEPVPDSAPLPPVKKKSHAALIAIVVVLLSLSGASAGGYFLYSRLKSLIGSQYLSVLSSIPWIKQSEDEKTPDENVSQEEPPVRTADKEPLQAILKIESQPPGADIWLDGEAKGISPMNLEVPLGAHRVRLSLRGHQDREEEVLVGEARDYHLDMALPVIPTAAVTPQKPMQTEPKTSSRKRVSTKPQDGAGTISAIPAQPQVNGPQPAVSPPPSRRAEPKRELPAEGWIIKDLQDR
jgi:eukaryotic-like serine/threonine-protein kinase